MNGIKCCKCKHLVPKIISITDDGKGIKVCIQCKKELKKKNPDLDYRFNTKEIEKKFGKHKKYMEE